MHLGERTLRENLVRVSSVIVVVALLLLIAGFLSRPFSEGIESIGNGYYTVDTGSVMRLGYHDKDGSMNMPFGPNVKGFRVQGDMIFVARWPLKTVEVDGHLEEANEGVGCQYWRIDTKSHAAVQINRADAKVDC